MLITVQLGGPGARPYACPHESCGMTFTNRQALAMHKKSIHDPKEHVCPVPGCGKRFSNSSTLNQHRLAHSDERPHKCEVAGCGIERNALLDAYVLRSTMVGRPTASALACACARPMVGDGGSLALRRPRAPRVE